MIEPGRYRHFKGGEYEVLFTATDSETEADMVVYRSADGRAWVRPERMFAETVEVDGERVSRFARFVRVSYDRLDIHMGDHMDSGTAERPAEMMLSEFVESVLAPFVPTLTWTGWTFRGDVHGEYVDFAEAAASGVSVRLLIPDLSLGDAAGSTGILKVGSRPTER